MQTKMMLLIVCTIILAAVAIITAFSNNREKRIILSGAVPVMLAVNTFYPPMYTAAGYFVAVFVCIVLQFITAFLNTKWMRLASGIMLAVIEIVLCVMFYILLNVYFFEHGVN